MVFRKFVRIFKASIGILTLVILFAFGGMRHDRSLAIAAQSSRVAIEILPGAAKSIDASRPFIPVALLGSADFDVMNVNPSSIRLAGAPITKRKNGQLRARYRDINGDGRIDLVVYVSVYSLQLDEGTSEATLTATMFDGRSVSGSQQVYFKAPVVQKSVAIEDVSASFSNPGLIKILDTDPKPTPAKPYPSTITVSGQPTITKLTVSIFGLWHTFPDDVDILLVGPTGATCVLMADCGGGNFITTSNPVNLSFADGSPSLPDNGQIVSGTYGPTRGTCFGGGDNCMPANFPGPAPSGPYGTALSAFNGTSPNGTWSLYVIDDSDGDDGQILSGWSLSINPATAPTTKTKFDFDGDLKTDVSIYRPSDGTWWVLNSSTGSFKVQQWGLSGDQLVPADYDGDGRTDMAIWRPSDGTWWILNSSTGNFRVQQWGFSTDIPVPGDYDGDGKADTAIFRPSDRTWWILNSSDGSIKVTQWGLSGDVPVPGDYDGDGKTDMAIWRPSDGTWWILNSSTGNYRVQQWGFSNDKLVPADYDGDGKTDIAIWRPSDGTWWILNSSTGNFRVQQWGFSSDVPVPGDYDGDGKADTAIFRPSDRTWWILNSSNGTIKVQQWGLSGDIAVPSVYIH